MDITNLPVRLAPSAIKYFRENDMEYIIEQIEGDSLTQEELNDYNNVIQFNIININRHLEGDNK